MADEVEDDGPDSTLGALRELLVSRGWHLLKVQADREWGPEGYGRRMQEALAKVPAGPDRAYEIADVAERVDATARAVHQIMRWPSEQLRELAPAKKPARFAGLRGITR